MQNVSILPWHVAVARTKKTCKIQSFNFWDLSVELAYPGGEIDKNSQPRDESAKPCYLIYKERKGSYLGHY